MIKKTTTERMEKLNKQETENECELKTGVKSVMVREESPYPATDIQDRSLKWRGDKAGPKALLKLY